MFKRVRAFWQRASRTYAGDPAWMTGAGTSRLRSVGVGADTREPYQAHEALYRCVSLKARTVAAIPVRVTAGEKDVTEKEWTRLLGRPNPIQRMGEFVEHVLSWWDYQGECFVALTDLDNAPTPMGRVPQRLWPVPGGMVQEDVVDGVLLGWWVTLPGTTHRVPFPVTSIVPLRYWNPTNPLRGMSPLAAAMRGVRLDLKASAYSEALYDNGADPGGVLSTEGALSKRQREDMRKEWEERHQGVDKAGRTAVLEGGLKYQQMVVNNRDLQHLEQRMLSRKQVATVYGVPMFFLNESTDAGYAAARAAMRVLWENALLPMAKAFEDAMLHGCLANIDARLRWQFDTRQVEALRDDLGARVDQVDKMVRAGVPRNAAIKRVDLGVPDVPGGDVALVQAGLAPLAAVASGATMGGVGGDVAGDPGAPSTNPDAIPQDDKGPAKAPGAGMPVPQPKAGAPAGAVPAGATAADTAAAGVAPANTAFNGAQVAAMLDTVKGVVAGEVPGESAKAILAVAFPVTKPQADAIIDPAMAAHAARPPAPPPEAQPPAGAPPAPKPTTEPPPRAADRADPGEQARVDRWRGLVRMLLTPWQSKVHARLRGWIQGRRAEALAALERFDRALDQAAWDAWLDEARLRWRKALADQVAPLYRQIADAAAAGVLPEIGLAAAGKTPITVATSPALLGYVERKVVLVQGVSDTVLDQVRKSVAATLANQGTVRDAQDQVRAVMNTTMSRSLNIARTETGQVVGGSRQEAMLAAGVREVEWLSSRDAVVRPNPDTHDDPAVDHRRLDGKRVPIGTSFVEGVVLHHPGDVRAQPARWVVGCRCLGLPVPEPLTTAPPGGKV